MAFTDTHSKRAGQPSKIHQLLYSANTTFVNNNFSKYAKNVIFFLNREIIAKRQIAKQLICGQNGHCLIQRHGAKSLCLLLKPTFKEGSIILNYTVVKEGDGHRLIIYQGSWDMEAGADFSLSNVVIKNVRVFLASGVVIAMSLSQLSCAIAASEGGESFSSAVFENTDRVQMRKFLNSSPKSFDMVSPEYFTINDMGSIVHGEIGGSFSQDIVANGGKIMPIVSYNYTKTAEILKMGSQIGEQLNALCKNYFLNGVIIDIPQASGQPLTDFLLQIKGQMGDFDLGVTVYPLINAVELDKINDICQIVAVNPLPQRAKDTPSPYYSFTEGEKVIKKVVSQGIDRDKMILNIDLGGRLWGPGWDGQTPIDPKTVGEITQSFAVRERFDKGKGAVYLDFTVKSGQNFFINGKRLFPADYTINIGSSAYVRQMLMVSNKHNLKGAALLHMPMSPHDLWEYFHTWLGSGYFEDVISTFGRDEIMKAYVDGVMIGVGGNRFAPYSPITRGEAAAIVSRLLKLPEVAKRPPFSDTNGHWAEKYIAASYYSGHMVGDIDGTFKPDDHLTREQAAVLSARLSGLDRPYGGGGIFTDVPPDSWSFDSIMALHKAGILKGYEDGSFRPRENMTREEIAILVKRLESVM